MRSKLTLKPENKKNMKAWRFLTVIILSFLLTGNAWAQPQLIPIIPASNQYPITFTDAAQQNIGIEFSEVITTLSTTTGWTITVNGISVALTGPVFDALNHAIIRFQIPSGITYANRYLVMVTYNQAAATTKLAGASGQVASFGPINAVNNLPLDCSVFDITKFDFSLALTEVCAPAHVRYTVTYYILSQYVNSIHYDKNNIVIQTQWGDGTGNETYGAEISTGVFQLLFDHVYPNNPSVCYWNSYIIPGVGGVGYCSGGGLKKVFTYENHATDNLGDGLLKFNTDTIKVCIGQDFSKIFTDATYFNCNPLTEPSFSNKGLRNIRFTYGTNNAAGARIQNILINGVAQTLPYQGSLITYDSIRTTGVPAPSGWASTDALSHVESVGPDAVGQIYEVMIENWNPCNPYNSGFGIPITTYTYIKIVDGPIANAGPDFAICSGNTATMAGQILHTATSGLWTTTGDGTFTNATSPKSAGRCM